MPLKKKEVLYIVIPFLKLQPFTRPCQQVCNRVFCLMVRTCRYLPCLPFLPLAPGGGKRRTARTSSIRLLSIRVISRSQP